MTLYNWNKYYCDESTTSTTTYTENSWSSWSYLGNDYEPWDITYYSYSFSSSSGFYVTGTYSTTNPSGTYTTSVSSTEVVQKDYGEAIASDTDPDFYYKQVYTRNKTATKSTTSSTTHARGEFIETVVGEYDFKVHMAHNDDGYWWERVDEAKSQIGTQKIVVSSGTIVIPIYDPTIGMDGKNQLRVSTNNGVGCYELVEINDANASPLRVSISNGIKAIFKQ